MRRLIIGEGKEGKSVVLRDDNNLRKTEFDYRSGKWAFMTEIWATDEVPIIPIGDEDDPTLSMSSIIPPPGGTRCRLMIFPHQKAMQEMVTDYTSRGSNIFEEMHKQAPGIEGTTDNTTGMHYTDTIDYGYIISGQIDLQLDDGKLFNLKAGDSYVLKGTMHSWGNPYDEPCVWVVFMIGGNRKKA